jgi:hypothetical protein
VVTRPPAKVDERARKVSLTLPDDAEAAIKHSSDPTEELSNHSNDGLTAPTKDEKTSLRKVAGPIPITSFALCIVEFAERASYYGAKTVFNNFIQFPLPEGLSTDTCPASRS